jgi:uncharacterized repeat protein (TIGR03803 family)
MLQLKANRSASSKNLTRLSLALITMFFVLAGASRPAHSQTYTVIHNFTGTDGSSPYAGPTVDASGHVYGTTYLGGATGNGSVYKLSLHGSSWLLSPLYSFGGGDGSGPGFGAVTIGPDGTLYGTTEGGGIFGAAFNVRPRAAACASVICPWMNSTVHLFGRGSDGAQPLAGVTFDSAGNLYGTTSEGGATGNGTVWQATHSGQSWTESVIYSFAGGSDAAGPVSGVRFDAAGNLYGTSSFGGANGLGAVYKLTRSGSGWTEAVIYNFQGANDGQNPVGGVVPDAAGNLYGTTFFGGANGGGTVYKLSPSGGGWTLTTLYSLSGGGGPYNYLTFDAAGNIYGTTNRDGAIGDGSVFKLSPNGGGWTFTDLYDFTNGTDGGFPYGSVAVDAHGNIFGTTSSGGSNNQGVVFEITP